MRACTNGKQNIVERLYGLENEGIIHKQEDWGTPLILSCMNWKVETVKWLFDKVKDVNEKDNNWRTALTWACMKWELEIANRLYNKGLNINEKDIWGRSPFMRACIEWKMEIVERLSDKVDINEKDNDWLNALSYASRNGEFEIIKWFYEEAKEEADKHSILGVSLFCICRKGYIHILPRVLEKIQSKDIHNIKEMILIAKDQW